MKNKGITLIALIITIIVLLILAGITIGMLTNNNGVLNQASNARTETSIGKEKELLQVGIFGAMTNHKENIVTEENLREEMKEYVTVETKRKKLIVTFKDSKRSYEVDTVGEIHEYKDVDVDILPIMSNSKFTTNLSNDEKESVLSVTVLNTLNPPADVYKILDVSVNGDGTVKAWLIENSENEGKYDLYIGGNNGVRVNSCNILFQKFKNCTVMDLYNFYTDGVTALSSMFRDCESLISLDIEHFNTDNVTAMGGMFANCNNLERLDVGNFNTTNVTSLGEMFRNCKKLKNIDVGNWNTSNVTDTRRMFDGCISLNSLDVENWDTSKIEIASGMFLGCYNLKSLNVSNWNTSSMKTVVVAYSGMFQGCSNLEYLDVSNWDVSNVTALGVTDGGMFQGCIKLKNLDVSKWNTKNVTNMKSLFNNCTSLTTLDLSNWDTSKVTDMSYTFRGCSGLTTIYAGNNWNISNVVNSTQMFYGCSSLSGEIDYNSSAVDKTYATTTGGYLTYKSN